MSDIAERFKSVRKKFSQTQEEFGQSIGTTRQQISNIEKSASNPSLQLVCKMITDLNVNANWLIAGVGEIFISPKHENIKSEIRTEVERIMKEKGIML